MAGKEYPKLILLTLLILTITLMPFNRGLKIQKAQGLFDFGLTDLIKDKVADPLILESCKLAGNTEEDCEARLEDAKKKEKELTSAACSSIIGKDACDFFNSLTLSEISVGALGLFYGAVCLPTKQLPVATIVTTLGVANVVGIGEGPGPGVGATFITSICDSIKRALNNVLKNELLGKLQNDILDWIERGGTGPVIVNNWGEFLETAGKNAIGDLAKEAGLGFLCSPFKFQIQITLTEPQRFKQRVTCTLDDIVANIQNFYDDFRNGGWIAYQKSWEPQNNIFGLALITVEEAAVRKDAAEKAAQNEGLAGGGYLSKKNCVLVTLPNGQTKQECTTTSPGSLVGNAAASVLVQTPIGSILSQEELQGFLSTIIDAAVNKIISSGIDKLKSGLAPR